MSGLPEVPNLDPTVVSDSVDTGGSPPAPAPKKAPSESTDSTVMAARPRPAPPAKKAVAAAPAVNKTPAPAAPPLEVPAQGPDTAPVPQKPAPDGLEDTAPRNDPHLNESIEEVLEHTTDQRVRLTRVEETLESLTESLSDVREEMHAGFIQTAAGSAAATPTVAGIDPLVIARIEEIASQNDEAERGRRKLTSLVMIQLVLLIALCAMVFLFRGSSNSASNYSDAPPPGVKLHDAPAPELTPAPSRPPAPDSKPNRRRRRRR